MMIPAPSFDDQSDTLATSIVHTARGAFSVETDVSDPDVVRLLTSFTIVGTNGILWTRHFGDRADRDAVLERFHAGALDILFLGRVTIIFGPAAITAAVDRVIENARKIRKAQAEAEAQRRRDHQLINLYAPDTQRGYTLELRRKSDSDGEWSVRFDRAIERDRLCDFVRWQITNFAEFLDFAAEHGAEALTRRLTDEMFEVERRIKKEGRSAGGVRPLRMWRGD